MKLIYRTTNKLWYYLHKYVLKHYGYGCKVRKDVWEREFSGHAWDYLESKDEEGRYHSIINFYSRFSPSGQILDIGCGRGVLFKYFKKDIDLNPDKYMGIDISETAIKQASKEFPSVSFSHLDFDKSSLSKKFDVIIFNETLNYFNLPIKTLQRCQTKNLNKDGKIIISMYDGDANSGIWKLIKKHFKILAHQEIVNDKNQKWNVRVIAPNTP